MCGIAGSLGRPACVAGLLARVRHRGPDRSRLLHLGGGQGPKAALAAARLRVTGGELWDMPLASADEQVQVVLNGEIFNHRDLFGPACPSDVAGLPDLLQREGPRALERLRGPFALLAWDARDQSLLVARDELGVRPLYLREGRDWVACASELPALMDELGHEGADLEAWAHLLAFQFLAPGSTHERGFRELEPGSWRRFRVLDGRLRKETGRLRYRSSCADPAQALAEAVALQAPCALKSGISLSGGLDSSAVAGLLTRAGSAPQLAAVGWFPAAPARLDERPHARAVARELNLDLVEVAITPERWWQASQRLEAALGGPLAGPGGPSQWLVAESLAQRGVQVLYSGQGGDEIFGGYERHRLLQQVSRGDVPRPQAGYEGLARQLLRGGSTGLLFRGQELLAHLEPDMAASVLASAEALPGQGPQLTDRLVAWEARVLLPGLLAVEDRCCSAFGMEGRVPLLDPVLARLVLNIPMAQKSPSCEPRRLFRRLLGATLPRAAARRRDKMGFPHPLASWFRGPLREQLAAVPWQALAQVGLRPSIKHAALNGQLSPRSVWWLAATATALAGRPARMEVAS